MTARVRTQVGIVGAGPVGLALARLLELAGIESVVLEARTREHVGQRIRAGVLEQGTVELLRDAGVDERLAREDLVHGGVHLQFDGERRRVPLGELTGRSIVADVAVCDPPTGAELAALRSLRTALEDGRA
jgi:p-hydroxybenzoate 3-monooxygenase